MISFGGIVTFPGRIDRGEPQNDQSRWTCKMLPPQGVDTSSFSLAHLFLTRMDVQFDLLLSRPDFGCAVAILQKQHLAFRT